MRLPWCERMGVSRIFIGCCLIAVGLLACCAARNLRPAEAAPLRAATTSPATTRVVDDPNPIPGEPPPPPVPFLSADEAIKEFHLPPGFRAEVVACEPMVQQP